MPIARPVEGGGGPDIGLWLRQLAPITRAWFLGTIVFTLAGRFGLANPHWLILDWTSVVKGWQIWRPLTALLFYPISPQTGFHFLINLYFLYSYSLRLETETYAMRPADYVVMLFFNWSATAMAGLWMNMYVLMDPMVLSVLYVWSQLNKDVTVSFWFGTRFKAVYLPWVMFAFNLIISGGGLNELIGIIVGHLYYYLNFRYPAEFGGHSLLPTPAFLDSYFPRSSSGQTSGFSWSFGSRSSSGRNSGNISQSSGSIGRPPAWGPPASASRPAADSTSHRWGQGQRLGDT